MRRGGAQGHQKVALALDFYLEAAVGASGPLMFRTTRKEAAQDAEWAAEAQSAGREFW